MTSTAQLRKAIRDAAAAAREQYPGEIDTRVYAFLDELCKRLGDDLGEGELDRVLWSLFDERGRDGWRPRPPSMSEKIRLACESARESVPSNDEERVRRFPATLSGWLGNADPALGSLVFGLYRQADGTAPDPASSPN